MFHNSVPLPCPGRPRSSRASRCAPRRPAWGRPCRPGRCAERPAAGTRPGRARRSPAPASAAAGRCWPGRRWGWARPRSRPPPRPAPAATSATATAGPCCPRSARSTSATPATGLLWFRTSITNNGIMFQFLPSSHFLLKNRKINSRYL